MKAVNLVLRQFYGDMTITQMIDLKIGKLTHGDVGQMDSYIRMFDDLYIYNCPAAEILCSAAGF